MGPAPPSVGGHPPGPSARPAEGRGKTAVRSGLIPRTEFFPQGLGGASGLYLVLLARNPLGGPRSILFGISLRFPPAGELCDRPAPPDLHRSRSHLGAGKSSISLTFNLALCCVAVYPCCGAERLRRYPPPLLGLFSSKGLGPFDFGRRPFFLRGIQHRARVNARRSGLFCDPRRITRRGSRGRAAAPAPGSRARQ